MRVTGGAGAITTGAGGGGAGAGIVLAGGGAICCGGGTEPIDGGGGILLGAPEGPMASLAAIKPATKSNECINLSRISDTKEVLQKLIPRLKF